VKLSEALKILHTAESFPGALFSVRLVCGFTPLHLATFLGAHLQKSLSGRRVTVSTGLYGDPAGTLEHPCTRDASAVAVVLEWADLDPRLGYRSLGGWGPAEENQIVAQVNAALERLQSAISGLGGATPVAVSLPTMPLPPAFHLPGLQAGEPELAIRAAVANFAVTLARYPGVSLANSQALLDQPAAQRFDVKAEILTGHPYPIAYADALATALARLLRPAMPKKGLITDLDDTLWSGIVGEVGADTVAWDLASHAHIHGLYQQTLAALAGQGVLLAVASKNNPEEVERVFARRDMVLGRDKVFPVEAHWGPKSQSVGRILKAWNFGADSVVFVDDSPMELAEVQAAWPDVQCILFPKSDPAAALALFRQFRDQFGKSRLTEEDQLRLSSLRTAASLSQDNAPGPGPEAFLSQAQAVVTAQFNPPLDDSRVVELVNKTNQFNLNGARYTEAEWRQTFDSPCSFVLLVSYADKFGPLGKIAVIAGRRVENVLSVQAWVMSCRAFSRRIEHGCMELLFSRFGVGELRFDFAPTPKNHPFRQCFTPFLGVEPQGAFTVTREQFETHCPRLYHKVETIA
jgi:FkbH-like protein